jgi:hypothetical protein
MELLRQQGWTDILVRKTNQKLRALLVTTICGRRRSASNFHVQST